MRENGKAKGSVAKNNKFHNVIEVKNFVILPTVRYFLLYLKQIKFKKKCYHYNKLQLNVATISGIF